VKGARSLIFGRPRILRAKRRPARLRAGSLGAGVVEISLYRDTFYHMPFTTKRVKAAL
jgi:hypothetical protein